MRCGNVLLLAGMAGGLCAIPWGIRAMRVGPGSSVPDRAVRRFVPVGRNTDGNSEGTACPAAHSRELDFRASPSETERAEQPSVAKQPSRQALKRAETGIGRIERIVSERKMPTRAAEAFRTQMANRLAASGADRAVVKAWLDRTVPPTPVRSVALTAAEAEPEQPPFDMSGLLTPEEREVIGMNANFIHAATHSNTRP